MSEQKETQSILPMQPSVQDLESVLFQGGKITLADIKEHIGGPIVSIALHAVILVLMATVFATKAPEQQAQSEIVVQAQEAEVVKPPEDEIEELEELPDPIETTDLVITDLAPHRPSPNRTISTDAVALTENVATTATPLDVDITALTVTDSNSALKMSGLTAFGRAGDGKGKGKGGGMDAIARATMLQGVFYDLKQTPDGKTTNLDGLGGNIATWWKNPNMKRVYDNYWSLMGEFANSDWTRVTRNGNISYPFFQGKYFSPPIRLMNSCLYIPPILATEAPKAFHCEDEVNPCTWIAIYGGRVVAPETGTFRFVGAGDDVLTVRFNGEIVLDYGFAFITLGATNDDNIKKAITKHDYSGVNPEVAKRMKASSLWKEKLEIRFPENQFGHGVCAGKTFRVEKGKTYDIDILISEIPGGHFNAVLFIEKVDPKPQYELDARGCPILPLFWTTKAIPKTGKGIPYDRNGPVWRVRTGKASRKTAVEDDISL